MHCHLRSVASLIIPIAHKFGVYVIEHSHSISNGRGWEALIKRLLQIPLYVLPDYYFACSKEAGRWLFGRRVIESNRFEVIPNMLDVNQFAYNVQEAGRIRSKYSIEDRFVIGHMGSFRKAKNHEFLLRVFQKVHYRCPNAVLFLVGEGELEGEIRYKAKKMGLAEDVIFAGSHTDPWNYYSAMDISVLPSLWEGFGYSVIEAQSSGLPCIISDSVPIESSVTDLVSRLSLDENRWTKAILNYVGRKREGLSEMDKNKLMKYDTNVVSHSVLKHYFLHREGR